MKPSLWLSAAFAAAATTLALPAQDGETGDTTPKFQGFDLALDEIPRSFGPAAHDPGSLDARSLAERQLHCPPDYPKLCGGLCYPAGSVCCLGGGACWSTWRCCSSGGCKSFFFPFNSPPDLTRFPPPPPPKYLPPGLSVTYPGARS